MLVLPYRLLTRSLGAFLAGACIERCFYPRLYFTTVFEKNSSDDVEGEKFMDLRAGFQGNADDGRMMDIFGWIFV